MNLGNVVPVRKCVLLHEFYYFRDLYPQFLRYLNKIWTRSRPRTATWILNDDLDMSQPLLGIKKTINSCSLRIYARLFRISKCIPDYQKGEKLQPIISFMYYRLFVFWLIQIQKTPEVCVPAPLLFHSQVTTFITTKAQNLSE